VDRDGNILLKQTTATSKRSCKLKKNIPDKESSCN